MFNGKAKVILDHCGEYYVISKNDQPRLMTRKEAEKFAIKNNYEFAGYSKMTQSYFVTTQILANKG